MIPQIDVYPTMYNYGLDDSFYPLEPVKRYPIMKISIYAICV
jgi:hypothetical protein